MSIETIGRIGGYDIVSVLGQGGMGIVYHVRDPDGRDLALKLLSTFSASDPLGSLRFQREFRLLASLQHPNLVSVVGTGEHEGRPFYTMELLAGQTLDAALPRGPERCSRLLAHAIEVCQ